MASGTIRPATALTTETKTSSKTTINAAAYATVTIDVSRSGCTPIAVAWLRAMNGEDGANYTTITFPRWMIDGTNLYVAARNVGGSTANVYIQASILYQRN